MRQGWSADRDPTRADLTFHTDRGKGYVELMLRPSKKRGQPLQPKVSQYIAEHDGGASSDTHAALARLVCCDQVAPHMQSCTPLHFV